MAATKRHRAGALVRRIPDEEGNLVTYMTASELARLINVGHSTINRWVNMGVVRYTDRLAGARNVSLADAAMLKRTPSKETLAFGICRTSEALRKKSKTYAQQMYDRTAPVADHNHEAWGDYDTDFLVSCYMEGRDMLMTARALGRTYDAVMNRLELLRRTGDLPPTRHDDEWWTRTRALLTDEELLALER